MHRPGPVHLPRHSAGLPRDRLHLHLHVDIVHLVPPRHRAGQRDHQAPGDQAQRQVAEASPAGIWYKAWH